jgi:L-alanine-DL-glutamate epimerase-like enolase superfamily enzyme
MRITAIDCHVLCDPSVALDATSSAQDTLLVEIHTDEGVSGIGETDLNAWIARACIEAPGTHTMDQGLADMLLGEDPSEVERLWERLYVGSAMSGRRGAVVNAIGALDLALWDLRGKAAGRPCHELMGGAVRDALTPYASLQPEGVSDVAEYQAVLVEWVLRARSLGFRAAKLELTFAGPYAHAGLQAPDEQIVAAAAACRAAVGDDFVLMVDVQYAFDSVGRALAVAHALAALDVFFLETPLWPDDLEEYAALTRSSPVPIAAGEWLTTRHEFADLFDRGGVAVGQPDIGRVGGLTEALRVRDLAAQRGRLIVPHAWKTAISIAASAHLAAVTPHCPFFEFLPAPLCSSALRRELVADDPFTLENGSVRLPREPGLGVAVDRSALERFEAAAERYVASTRARRRAVAGAPAGPEAEVGERQA